MTRLVCWRCKKEIVGARTVIGEQWHCSDCTYLHDHPDATIAKPRRQRTRRNPQDEHLFTPPPPREKDSHHARD